LLGKETYQAVLDSYASHGAIDSDLLLKPEVDLRSRMRYLVLPRIVKDSVDRATPDVEEKKQETGETIPVYTFNITRVVDVSVHVYDLTAEKAVWSGVISEQDSRRTSKEEGEIDQDHEWEVNKGFWEDLLDSLFGWLFRTGPGQSPPAELYPTPPGIHAILRSAFEAFANDIPEKLDS
jgi:hypothetical protein